MTTKWTTEQLEAINTEGTNIIVSAGAGSGKTAVLSERVLRKVLEKTHINELLILTFTNAAAKEMKDRIRKKLIKENLLDEVSLVDSAYITTFDSFSLSIVKKYHTNLNITSNVSISSEAIIGIKKQEILEKIMNEYYENHSEEFKLFIKDFCYKDDKDLLNNIIKISNKLDMRYDKLTYLNTYLDKYYSDEVINNYINEYFQIISTYIEEIKSVFLEMSEFFDSKYLEKLEDVFTPYFNAKGYDDLVGKTEFSMPRTKNTDEDATKLKDKLTALNKEIKALMIYDSTTEMKEEILATYSNTKIIISILKNLDTQLNLYKKEENIYDFNDIAKMAISIVENNSEIKEELKNKFKEIMVDEYQDTNDLQEYFISLISTNNVYMVGDIKQSIYRFRNANPYIFKNKYDKYTNNKQGLKIDLNKNFRSRNEVLTNINDIFDYLMDDRIGGADYKKSHQMIFGNKAYIEKSNIKEKYDLDIYTYPIDKEFKNEEKEIFIIGNDIKKKMANNYQVFDKDTAILRKAQYNDFVILIDRKSSFDLYKKIFEYLQIPLTLEKDEDIKQESDIVIIKNILRMARLIKSKDFNAEFKYLFMSLGRSFLFRIPDDVLFNYFYEDSFKDNIIYERVSLVSNILDELSPSEILFKLDEIFDYEKNLLTTNNIMTARVRYEYFYNLLKELEETGKTIDDFINYLDTIFSDEYKVNFSISSGSNNSVKIMTIHKSKGLEYPICYFAGFKKEFSKAELNDNILYSNKYGLVIPYFNEYIKPTFYKTLLKYDNKCEEISERIRVLYVALTRAREKMIIVTPEFNDNSTLNTSFYEKTKYKSFYDMLNSVSYILKDYCLSFNNDLCSKEYLKIEKSSHIDSKSFFDNLKVEEQTFNHNLEISSKYSKTKLSLLTKDEQALLNQGIEIHKILENLDFYNPELIHIDKSLKKLIELFLESKVIKDSLEKNSKFYKEYEFIYQKDNLSKHGIIDLMIVADDIIIIDYKLKNIDDNSYYEQLNGYRDYIKEVSNKKVTCYLYSIIDNTFKEIK